MNAKEARMLSFKNNERFNQDEWDLIQKEIIVSVEMGEFVLHYGQLSVKML